MQTKQRAMLGKTTYPAVVTKWENDEPVVVWTDEFPYYQMACVGTQEAMVKHNAESGTIREGTYQESNIEDEEYGLILDVDWVEAPVQWDLWIDNSGTIHIDRSEW